MQRGGGDIDKTATDRQSETDRRIARGWYHAERGGDTDKTETDRQTERNR